MTYPLLILLFISLALILPVHSVLGFDLAKPYDLDVYKCLKSNGFSFGIIRGYRSLGIVDTNAVANLNNARNAGLDTDVYLFPCQSKNATQQVTEMMNAIPNNLYGTIWIDVETNPSPNCGWSEDFAKNCLYLKQIVQAVKNRGKKPGIYATAHMWIEILGDRAACPYMTDVPLWYAHYDNKQTLDDYAEFGGWKTPSIKQFNDRPQLCGADIDYNFHP